MDVDTVADNAVLGPEPTPQENEPLIEASMAAGVTADAIPEDPAPEVTDAVELRQEVPVNEMEEEPEKEELVPEPVSELAAQVEAEKPESAVRSPKAAIVAPGATGDSRVRRERKPAEHFHVDAPKEQAVVPIQGKGTKLRDIPNVDFKMSKITGRDDLMESLHNVLYRRKGMANTRKKAILDFNGFGFPEDQDEREIDARKVSMGKWKLDLIHRLMDTLDLPRGTGDKSAKIDRVIDFLKEPRKQSDVDLASKEAAKKEAQRRKRERDAKKKETKAKTKSSAKKAKIEAAEDESDAEEPLPDEEDEGSDFEEVVPKPKERGSTGTKKRVAIDDDDESEEEEKPKPTPKPKATPKPPKAPSPAADDPALKLSEDQLRTDLGAVMDRMTDEELGHQTAKSIMAQMAKHYGFDVRSRKTQVKQFMFECFEKRSKQGEAAAAAPGGEVGATEPKSAPEEAA